uniref:NADH-ubiquinone oxidoreductase chain 6 n=1 Tax=Talaromyces stipitatus (strain ATCC 10500 / CBS 375.48 / QM 6759 / NRRL 1006) TaxID=441959 RepID=H9CNM0_TALSN|nr:NADH dehydrogenase subunit 6 [Talaromyces stipitatus]
MNNINILKDINYGFIPEMLDIIYLLSIIFGISIIINKNPIISVLFLIGLFVNISTLLIIIGFGFIGLSYILVYVGAVSILFLFILMLINIRISELTNETNNDTPLAILTVMLFYFLIARILPGNLNFLNTNVDNSHVIDVNINEYIYDEQIQYASSKSWDTSLVDITHISGIGNVMYTNYAIWLIIASIILLLAMVGSIVITKKAEKR